MPRDDPTGQVLAMGARPSQRPDPDHDDSTGDEPDGTAGDRHAPAADGDRAGGGPPSTPTPPADDGLVYARRNLWWRRAFVVVLVAFVLAGATGWLGVRTGTTRAEGDGVELTVTYPRIARPGLGVAWRVHLRSDTGFDGPVSIAVPTGWLQRLDFMDQTPAPDAQTNDGHVTTFTWDAVDGTEHLVVWDVRIEPGTVGWHDVDVEVTVGPEHGPREVSAHFRSWILP
jgi:hypothetical protein